MFVVQGEGRGHSTQAIALKKLIEDHGHQVACVLVGTSGNRPMEFFKDNFGEISAFRSPNFAYDKNGHAHFGSTIVKSATELLCYQDAFDIFTDQIALHDVDRVVNFYEPLFGAYRMLYDVSVKSFAIGHQFMFLHPDYIKLKRFKGQAIGAKFFTKMVGFGSTKIALSFYDAPDYQKITVIPPILRKQVFEMNSDKPNGGFVLVYAINPQAVQYFIDSVKHQECHLFTETAEVKQYGKLIIHPLNGEEFLSKMAQCSHLICSAGFESVSEAVYLGKRVQMVPIKGHMEQFYNAHDAERRLGNCQYSEDFDLRSATTIPFDAVKTQAFRAWVDAGEEKLVRILGL